MPSKPPIPLSWALPRVAAVRRGVHRVCDMQFFNPALVMKCVEVARHQAASQATVDATMELARRLGKEPVLINCENSRLHATH